MEMKGDVQRAPQLQWKTLRKRGSSNVCVERWNVSSSPPMADRPILSCSVADLTCDGLRNLAARRPVSSLHGPRWAWKHRRRNDRTDAA